MSEIFPINRDIKQFKKFWNNSKINDRITYIAIANLTGYFEPIRIWEEIETNQQAKLREAIRYIINGDKNEE